MNRVSKNVEDAFETIEYIFDNNDKVDIRRKMIYYLDKLLNKKDVSTQSLNKCPYCGQLEPCANNSPETCYHPKVCKL